MKNNNNNSNNNINSTSSPNNSDSSNNNNNNVTVVGLVPMHMHDQQQDVFSICMDSSSSSSSQQESMQASMMMSMVMGGSSGGKPFNPFPNFLDTNIANGYNNTAGVGGGGLFNLSSQVGMQILGGGSSEGYNCVGDYGMVETNYNHHDQVHMGLESDDQQLCLPALESRVNIVGNINNVSNDYGFGSCDVYNKKTQYNGEMLGMDHENHWQGESLRNNSNTNNMGELDWEGLLANVSSLPFLDFQVE